MGVSLAAAQQVPQPVVRLGDWVEISNEAFMNVIGTADLRYRTVKNYDFEDDIRDRASSRDPFSTVPTNHEGDLFWVLAQFGVDFKFQKNLPARVLFRHETTLVGNLVDTRENDSNPGGTDTFGRAANNEGEGTNLERLWIDYTFPAPVDWLRMFVGFEIWCPDQACLLSDDDPRFTVFANFGPLEVKAAAVIQSEALRIGLQNDNDFIYYIFGAAYNFKPHRVALDVAYFRERFNGAPTAANARIGEKHDSVLIMPSWTGGIGPFRGLLQFNVVLGTAEGTSRPSAAQILAGATPSREFDIFGWGLVAYGEVNLGVVKPFIGFVYGSGDDDPNDDELHGFMTLPQREITILGTGMLGFLDRAISFASRDVACPARRTSTALGSGTDANNQECFHTVGNPFNDRVGNTSHAGINSTYSNPGTILAFAGLQIFPLKGHQIYTAYFYRAMVDSRFVEDALGVKVDEHLYHELMAGWMWTLNQYFDIRLAGSIAIPGDGSKDIAQTVTTCGATRTSPCSGEDIALAGEARFRVQF
jgi:hypothetical protein